LGSVSIALADDSGHLSINTLKTEQYAQQHHMGPSSAAVRDPVGAGRHTRWYAHSFAHNYAKPY
jgi:hypothetical protein